jgi:LPS-assembly lipoprotein
MPGDVDMEAAVLALEAVRLALDSESQKNGRSKVIVVLQRPSMWLPDPRALRLTRRLAVIGAAAATIAGCFHPMYGDAKLTASPNVAANMATVDVNQIAAPNGTPLSRIAVGVRDKLLFGLTGGSAAAPPVYRLNIQIGGSSESLLVDINSGRPDTQDYALNATYTLMEVKTGAPVLHAQTFARVSYDIPGQAQRFARDRGLRDAEDRAAQQIADNIKARLASFFVAGT